MRAADSDAELDRRIYALGEFEKIINIAKRLLIKYLKLRLSLVFMQELRGLACCFPVPPLTSRSTRDRRWIFPT